MAFLRRRRNAICRGFGDTSKGIRQGISHPFFEQFLGGGVLYRSYSYGALYADKLSLSKGQNALRFGYVESDFLRLYASLRRDYRWAYDTQHLSFSGAS